MKLNQDQICGLGAKSLKPSKHITTISTSQDLLCFVDLSAFDLDIKAKLIWGSHFIRAHRLEEYMWQYLFCSNSEV